MPVWKWSTTAATNAASDPSINWAEGQLPSTVNDSARAMMAAIAAYREDISGAVGALSGDGVNFTFTSRSGFDSFANMDRALFGFTPLTNNVAGACTLNVDGLGARPILYKPGAEGNLPANSLVPATPYHVRYENNSGAFYLINGAFQTFGVPVGGILIHSVPSAPNSNFTVMWGQAVSRTSYASLFAAIGTTYGSGDGSSTFNLPDIRGRVPAGWDPSAATGRLTTGLSGVNGGAMGSAGGTQNQSLSTSHVPPHTHSGTTGGMNASNPHSHTYNQAGLNPSAGSPLPGGNPFGLSQTATGTSTTDINHGHPFTTDGGTGSSAGLIMIPPTIVLNYLIRII